MRNERVLIADDYANIRELLAETIEIFGEKDGHKVVATASSVEEVEELLKGGLRPSVALVDGNFPDEGDGEEAAKIIRKISPETTVISFSSEVQTWGDENWSKHLTGRQLAEALTKLQHKK